MSQEHKHGYLKIARTVTVFGGFTPLQQWARLIGNVLCLFKDSTEATADLRVDLNPDNVKLFLRPKLQKVPADRLQDCLAMKFTVAPNGVHELLLLFADTVDNATQWFEAIVKAMVVSTDCDDKLTRVGSSSSNFVQRFAVMFSTNRTIR